jgi:ubiquinone/menaquinone biosynthesis C-methylase UbiE
MHRVNDDFTEIIRRHWDRCASIFDDQAGHGLVSDEQRRAWLDLLSRFSGRSDRVLDVGCGTGFLALRFAELGHTVTGIDLSPQMIDRARSKADEAGLKIDFRVGDASAIDCDDGTYDIVVARHLVWILPDPERGVAEWLRVLRPRGRLIFIEGKWADYEARGDEEAVQEAGPVFTLSDCSAVSTAEWCGNCHFRVDQRQNASSTY